MTKDGFKIQQLHSCLEILPSAMVALKYFVLLALISLECVTSKKFGGSRFKIITNRIPSFKFPGSGLFSSASDGNSGGMIGSGGAGVGAGGGGLRGGGSGGSIPGNDKTNLGDDFNEKSSKDAGAILFFSSLLKSYSSLLDKFPYPTKMVTSAFIGALGDYLVQTFEARKTKKALDLRRVAVFATVCGLYIAPVIHVWFEYLNVMPFLTNMGKYSKAFAMMFVDQSVGATVITLGFFYAFEAVSTLPLSKPAYSSFLLHNLHRAPSMNPVHMIITGSGSVSPIRHGTQLH